MMPGLKRLLDDVGGCVLFTVEVVQNIREKRVSWHDLSDEVWKVTFQSAATTALAGFFVGAIMTIQFTMLVRDFGALSYLGGLSTSGTIREVGPLLIAFMLSGKVGAFTSAELGTMRVTEQIDAIRCLGADPIQELVVPRLLGIIVASFFLLAIGLLASVFGGLWFGVIFSGIHPEEYLRHIPTIVTIASILSGLLKCLIFSVVLASICTYKGYTASGGAKGVGQAVVSTAVTIMVGLVVADWVTSLLGDAIVSWFVG